ncbi:MAG: hypothetical protein CMJ28_07105 [Phycisphaerae bacterium]|nr:hypothetical protein [Phycisphaerae bacterium]
MVSLVALAMAAAGLWGLLDGWIIHPLEESGGNLASEPVGHTMDASIALLISALVTASFAGLVRIRVGASPRDEHGERELDLRNREVLALVGLAWFVACFFAALPFVAWPLLAGLETHVLLNPINCLFESMSGLTTTGATIIPELDTIPRPLLLWRSLTHWIGGIGIVVVFLVILPSVGAARQRLFQVETPGPDISERGLRPTAGEAAKKLSALYLGITAAAVGGYIAGGMGAFDAVNHAFSVVATGGFSTKDESISYFATPFIEWWTILMMIMVGLNFTLLGQLLRGRLGVLKDLETKTYLGLKLTCSVLTTLVLALSVTAWSDTAGVEHTGFFAALRHGTFVTVAMQTGTGFCLSDYSNWPYLTIALIFSLAAIGGCGGSTAGGIKVNRIVFAVQLLWAEIHRVIRPNRVDTIRLGHRRPSPTQRQAVLAFLLMYMMLLGIGTIGLQTAEHGSNHGDFQTCSTAVLCTLTNIGPGLGEVGPTGNYEGFGSISKAGLVVLMAMGRLEIMGLIALLTPGFWRRS